MVLMKRDEVVIGTQLKYVQVLASENAQVNANMYSSMDSELLRAFLDRAYCSVPSRSQNVHER